MYCSPDFKTKKALKEAIANKTHDVSIYQPGPFENKPIEDGIHSIEGPHFPQPHSWYARVIVKNETIIAVK